MVGVSGFEPEASWSRTKRDTKLRHTPISDNFNIICLKTIFVNSFLSKKQQESPHCRKAAVHNLLYNRQVGILPTALCSQRPAIAGRSANPLQEPNSRFKNL